MDGRSACSSTKKVRTVRKLIADLSEPGTASCKMTPSSLSDKYRRAMRYELIKWLGLKPVTMRLFSKIYVRDDTESAKKEAMPALLSTDRHGQVEAPSSMEELASMLIFKHLVMDDSMTIY